MANTKRSVTNVSWQDEALCNGANFDFTPDRETVDGCVTAKTWCNLCPVRTECLRYALVYHIEGYWGGTTTQERKKLSAKKNRAKCPVCTSQNLIVTEIHELCLSCGLSWTRGKPPVPKLTVVPSVGTSLVPVPERYL